jgi:hypothetical protein
MECGLGVVFGVVGIAGDLEIYAHALAEVAGVGHGK